MQLGLSVPEQSKQLWNSDDETALLTESGKLRDTNMITFYFVLSNKSRMYSILRSCFSLTETRAHETMAPRENASMFIVLRFNILKNELKIWVQSP